MDELAFEAGTIINQLSGFIFEMRANCRRIYVYRYVTFEGISVVRYAFTRLRDFGLSRSVCLLPLQYCMF